MAAHLATCKEMYFEYAFGSRKKSWDDLTVPGDAAGMRLYLARTQGPLRQGLEGLGARELDGRTLTNWGEEKPIWWILSTMVLHDMEHGGQIWQVRNQYGVSRRLARAVPAPSSAPESPIGVVRSPGSTASVPSSSRGARAARGATGGPASEPAHRETAPAETAELRVPIVDGRDAPFLELGPVAPRAERLAI